MVSRLFFRCCSFLSFLVAGAGYPKEYGGGGGLDSYDAFHSVIFADEFARTGAGGVTTALTVGVGIGLGPVMAGGSDDLKKRVAVQVLNADKFICLAVTESKAGSDVSGIETTATLDASGKFYIVSGEKKFISGAAYADYFTTAVKTENGIAVLLIEKSEGVKVRRLQASE
jgi:alkylation response protein AidB-like acyl-CoA dehydrogenase